jgi:hypothetical protein
MKDFSESSAVEQSLSSCNSGIFNPWNINPCFMDKQTKLRCSMFNSGGSLCLQDYYPEGEQVSSRGTSRPGASELGESGRVN